MPAIKNAGQSQEMIFLFFDTGRFVYSVFHFLDVVFCLAGNSHPARLVAVKKIIMRFFLLSVLLMIATFPCPVARWHQNAIAYSFFLFCSRGTDRHHSFSPCWSSQNCKPPLLCVELGFCAWAITNKAGIGYHSLFVFYRIENGFPHFGCWCGEPAEPCTYTYQCATHNNGRLLFQMTNKGQKITLGVIASTDNTKKRTLKY